jgi:hypothetical protein
LVLAGILAQVVEVVRAWYRPGIEFLAVLLGDEWDITIGAAMATPFVRVSGEWGIFAGLPRRCVNVPAAFD